jgi:RNase P protein component
MLPKQEKFTARDLSDKSIFKNSKKIYTPYGFFLVLSPSPTERVGVRPKKTIILTKKNFKTAVSRNKHKRIYFNTLLEVFKQKPELRSKSFIFYPNKIFTKDDIIPLCLQLL